MRNVADSDLFEYGSVNSGWVPFSESGKDKAARGEEWVPPFI